MEMIRLGSSDLQVPRLAVGCWQLSPSFWGEVDLVPWRAALDAAFEQGFRFVDTANAYGDGFAEEELGRYLKERGNRDQWVIATKFFWDFWTPLPDHYSMRRTVSTSKQQILRACEDSLRRLGIDCIDLYQLHSWDPLIHPEEFGSAMDELKSSGKIRAFGVSNLNVEQMELLSKHTKIDTLQPKYNLIARDPEKREFPHCLLHGISTLLYSPLERGLFGGHMRAGNLPQDARAKARLFSEDGLHENAECMAKLGRLAEENDCSLAQFAIRWVLTHPAASVALIGTKKPEHITTLGVRATEPLPSTVWHEAAAIARQIKKG
jgi:aryl-alcohol dehydrogenase-like predicted oxidoreductase